MQAEKAAKKLEMRRQLAGNANDDDEVDYSSYTPSTDTAGEQPQEDNRIVLKLRDKNNKDISMRVKPVSITIIFCSFDLRICNLIIILLYYLYV